MMKVNCEHRFSITEDKITLTEIGKDKSKEVSLSEFLHDTYFYTHTDVSLEVDGIVITKSARLKLDGEIKSFWNESFAIPHMVTEIVDKRISFTFTFGDNTLSMTFDRDNVMGGGYNPITNKESYY